MSADEVISFWFDEIQPEQWFTKDEKFDAQLRERFLPLHRQARIGELWAWRKTAEGRLAEIIVLDQFSRNIFRDQPESFGQDALALILAQEAVAAGADRLVAAQKRSFFYLPFMHSESPLIHEEALKLYTALGLEGGLDYEKKHKKIIDRFGRFPHRNKILGRVSSAEEIEFLKGPNSAF